MNRINKLQNLLLEKSIPLTDIYQIWGYIASKKALCISITPNYDLKYGYWIADTQNPKKPTVKNNHHLYKTFDECLISALIECLKRIK